MTKPGIYQNIDINAYHGEKEYISATSLKLAKKSLKLYKLYREGKVSSSGKLSEDKVSHFEVGNAFELALLDPKAFDEQVGIYDVENRPEKDKFITSTKNQAWKKEFYSSHPYVVTTQEYAVIAEMITSCYQDAVIQKLIKNIEYQFSMYWIDKDTGLQLKTRPDICRSKDNIIVDVKTTIDGSPEAFSRDLAKYDYPLQAVMQVDGVIQSGFMQSVDKYYWLVVEKEPPFSATLYEFAQDEIKHYLDEYEYILKTLKKAIDLNHYPSYSYRADNKYGIITANIPLWYKNYGL